MPQKHASFYSSQFPGGKVAQEASKMASTLKSFSSKLPPGMRDYYEFIFTVAENTDKMAKVVYDYVGKLEKAMAELNKDSKNMGEKNSKFNNGGVPGCHSVLPFGSLPFGLPFGSDPI